MVKGTYTFTKNGVEVARVDNIVTDAAKATILDFLAGRTRAWAVGIGVGISAATPASTDRHLGFETTRSPVNVREPLYADGAIIAKATLPLNFVGQIYEVGLFNAALSQNDDPNNYIITYFSPEFDVVTGTDSVEGRLGSSSSQILLSGTSGSATVEEISVQLDNLSSRDQFRFAYNANDITDVSIRFYNDDGNYRTHQFTVTGGFNVEEFTVADVTGTGTFDKEITSIMVLADGVDGGALKLEGLRFHSATLDNDEVLISHATLASPIDKGAGKKWI